MTVESFTVTELRRLATQLVKTDPASDDYLSILRSIECFSNIGVDLNLLMDAVRDVPEEKNNVIDFHKEEHPDLSPVVEEKTTETSTVTSTVTPAPTESAVTYELADVRKALTEAKKNGLNVAEFIRSYGVDNITAVPQSKYADIMAKLGAGN